MFKSMINCTIEIIEAQEQIKTLSMEQIAVCHEMKDHDWFDDRPACTYPVLFEDVKRRIPSLTKRGLARLVRSLEDIHIVTIGRFPNGKAALLFNESEYNSLLA